MVVSERCVVPPAGWACSREAGHDGPCAAVPVKGHPALAMALRIDELEAEVGRLRTENERLREIEELHQRDRDAIGRAITRAPHDPIRPR